MIYPAWTSIDMSLKDERGRGPVEADRQSTPPRVSGRLVAVASELQESSRLHTWLRSPNTVVLGGKASRDYKRGKSKRVSPLQAHAFQQRGPLMYKYISKNGEIGTRKDRGVHAWHYGIPKASLAFLK